MEDFFGDLMGYGYMMNDDYDWEDSFALTSGTEEQRKYYLNMINGNTGTPGTAIISAAEARKLLDKEIEEDNSCLLPIMERIQLAIKRKENHCYINNEKEHVLNKLAKLGYTISDIIKGDRPSDPDSRKISW